MQFVVHERLEAESAFAQMAAHREIDAATFDVLAEEAGKFCAEVQHRLNEIGDREGQRIVLTPSGFKEAYAKYVAGNWPGLAGETQCGEQRWRGGTG